LSKIGLKIYYLCQHSKIAKTYFISGKQFQKRPNLTGLAIKKAKWQPWVGSNSPLITIKYATTFCMNEATSALISKKETKKFVFSVIHFLLSQQS